MKENQSSGITFIFSKMTLQTDHSSIRPFRSNEPRFGKSRTTKNRDERVCIRDTIRIGETRAGRSCLIEFILTT